MTRTRLIFAAMALVVSAASARADGQCFSGSSTVIAPFDWSFERVDETTNHLTFTVKSSLPKDTRLVSLQAAFLDRLGGPIGGFDFGRDVAIPAGGTYTFDQNISSAYLPRLHVVAREDVVPLVCTTAVVYADGTTETFN